MDGRSTTDKSDESSKEGPRPKLQKEGVMKNDDPEVSPRRKKPQAQDSVMSGGGHETIMDTRRMNGPEYATKQS
jgi:hypothetical protein